MAMEGDWDPPSALQFCARSQLKFPSPSSGEAGEEGLEEVWPLQNPPPPPLSLESFSSAALAVAVVKAKAAIVKAHVRFLLSIAEIGWVRVSVHRGHELRLGIRVTRVRFLDSSQILLELTQALTHLLL